MKNDIDIAMIKQQESNIEYGQTEHIDCSKDNIVTNIIDTIDCHDVRKHEVADIGLGNSSDAYDKGVSSADAVFKAGSALGRAVSNVEECANILTAADDNKLFVRFLSRLIAIKDGLGSLLEDLESTNFKQETHDSEFDIVKSEIQEYDDIYNGDLLDYDMLENKDKENIDEEKKSDNDNDDEYIPNSGKKPKLRNNRLRKRKKKQNYCDKCSGHLDKEEDFLKHKTTCVPSGCYACNQCPRSFTKERSLKKHQSSNHLSDLKCPIKECSLEFKTKKELNQHKKKMQHTKYKLMVECQICKKSLRSMQFQTHMDNFHSKAHACKLCNQAFNNYKDLRDHLLESHKTGEYKCTSCSLEFDNIISLQSHLQQQDCNSVYSCSFCSKLLATPKNLRVHIENQHSKKFKCKDCDAAFDTRWEFNKHTNSEHKEKDETLKVCQICGFTSSSPGAFHTHQKYHGPKTNKCEVCEKAFVQKHALKEHMRVHTGEKPYVCQVCGAKFSKSCHLSRHRFVHNGEKPFVCNLCGKGFNQPGILKTHMKSHASENVKVKDE